MMSNKPKIFTQFAAGLFAGVNLGVLAFSLIYVYGMSQICTIFNPDASHVSENWPCIQLTGLFGVIVGSFLGVLIFHFLKIPLEKNKKITLMLTLWTVVLPLIYAFYMVWAPFDPTPSPEALLEPLVLLVIFSGLGLFILFSSISSALITLLFNVRGIFKK